MGHFSKFISPNSVRIQNSASPGNVLDTLSILRPDNRIVIVVLNRFEILLLSHKGKPGSVGIHCQGFRPLDTLTKYKLQLEEIFFNPLAALSAV